MSCTEETRSSLEQLASKKFGRLTEAETRMVHAAALGGPAYCGPENRGPDAPENAPENASSWGNEREIRADLVTWLCADREASGLIHARGITVASAKVVGGLNLSAVKVPFPLIFFKCCFSGAITLVYSDLLLLGLDGCLVRPDGNEGVAVNADSLRARAVNLRHGFHAFGAVNLRGAEIANNLELDGGHVANPTGVALSLNAARIGGVVFLRNGFTAQGEINLTGAYIGLGVDCSGARFDGGGTSAFTANGSKIGRKVNFSGATALGQVSLVASEIGSDLSIDRADFRSATLCIERARIRGGIFARNTQFGTEGFMDLSGASADSLDDDPDSWPSRDHVDIDGFVYGYLRRPDHALRRLELLSRQPLDRSAGDQNPHVRAQPYRHLSKVLREMGYEKEARKVLIGLEEERDRREHFSKPERCLRRFYSMTLRYGYEPTNQQ